MNTITNILGLANKRLEEAQLLESNGYMEGAYYLAGYAAELTLKARICKILNFDEFYSLKQPLKKGSDAFFTHELTQLLTLSGLRKQLENETDPGKGANLNLSINWQTVCQWNERKRYDCSTGTNDASELIKALTDVNDGFLPWIQKNW